MNRLLRRFLWLATRIFRRPTTKLALILHRASFEAYGRSHKIPAGVCFEACQVGTIAGEIVTAGTTESGIYILYLHGGGYYSGSSKTHRALAAGLAQATRAKVLLVNYRLAPEHPFPAALEDAIESYRWLMDQKPARLVIAGDSAGGGLALATTLKLRDLNLPQPAAVICLSPWVDLTKSFKNGRPTGELEDGAILYAGKHDPTHPFISPIRGNLKELPPLLIQAGSDEDLLEEAQQLAGLARTAGVEVQLEVFPEMWHVWQLAGPTLPTAREAFEKIAIFIREKTRSA